MFVKDYMTRHPILIEPGKKVIEVQQLMVENNVRHLPVVGDGKRLLGLCTRERLQIPPDRFGSLNVWEITRFLADLTVDKVMIKAVDLHTIGPETAIEDAARLLTHHKIGGLVVVEDGMVVGVITETDLLVELQELLGAYDPGWRVTIRIPDNTGESDKITSVIHGNGWGIMAMGAVRTPKQSGKWDVVVKICDCEKDELVAALAKIEGQEIIDVRETTVYPD